MNWDFIMQYLDFTNVTNIINIAVVAILSFLTFKQRAQLIVSKFKQAQLNEEVDKKDLVLEILTEEMNFFGTTLLQIVQASKMTPDQKLSISQNWFSLQSKTQDFYTKTVEDAQDLIKDVKEITAVGSELFEGVKDILGNVVKSK